MEKLIAELEAVNASIGIERSNYDWKLADERWEVRITVSSNGTTINVTEKGSSALSTLSAASVQFFKVLGHGIDRRTLVLVEHKTTAEIPPSF